MVDGTLALSIPGLFLTCVQYFNLVQLGRNFTADFGSCLLRLRAIELRLHRWGKAAGITDEDFATRLQERYNDQEIQFAYNACRQIKKQLMRAKEDSQEMLEDNQKPEELELVDEIQQLEICGPKTTRARRFQDKVKSGYQTTLHFGSQAAVRSKWALYKKPQLEGLLSTISEHVTTLETLFPQQELALVTTEARELEPKVIETLAPITKESDPLLANALQAEYKRQGFRYEHIEVMGHAAPHLGSVYSEVPKSEGQTVYSNLKFGGNARGQAGNIYGYNPQQATGPSSGSPVFDD